MKMFHTNYMYDKKRYHNMDVAYALLVVKPVFPKAISPLHAVYSNPTGGRRCQYPNPKPLM